MNDQHDDGAGTAGPRVAIDEEAMDWAIRMTGADADWDAFMEWLEADAARAGRYDRAASALRDAEVAVAAAPVATAPTAVDRPAANDADPSRRFRRWIGGALAAALVGVIGLGMWSERARPYSVETAAGQQRTVALADGSTIALAGGSRVRLDRSDPRVATVERGEMLFRIRHDADRPFAVAVGDLRLVDLGTVFDVNAAAGRTRVAVAEGAVMVDPEGAAVRLGPGQAVLVERSSIIRQAVEPADVGSWLQGSLVFDDVPLDGVAADLSRQLGRRIRAAPSVARRTFRGTLDSRSIRNDPELLGKLLGVSVRVGGDGWVLEPHP